MNQEPVYRVDGVIAVPTPYAAGPWNPKLQHGGAPASLIAWAADRIASREPMRVTRLTLDLLRPVPIAPLQIETDVVREGRKIQLVNVRLLAEGVEVVRASVLRTREAQLELPQTAAPGDFDMPGPETGHEPQPFSSNRQTFARGFSMRVVKGALNQPGPAAVWFRCDREIVEDEPTTPLMRAAATADFCNGISSALEFKKWTFVNADLTINLQRLPVGEWILLDAVTSLGDRGVAISAAKLADRSGYFGNASQSLIIEPRQVQSP